MRLISHHDNPGLGEMHTRNAMPCIILRIPLDWAAVIHNIFNISTLTHPLASPALFKSALLFPFDPFYPPMDPWSADKRTDKERFFDGLYSIPKLDSDDTPETSAATLLLAASRDQRNTVPNLIPRGFYASTATLDTPAAPATTRASTMPTTKSEKMVPTACASLPPPDPTPLRSPPPPESSRMLSSSAVTGKVEKRKRAAKSAPALSQKNQIFKNLYFCECTLCWE